MKEYRLTIRLSSDLRQRVLTAARKTGKPESDVVREALERQLPTSRKRETALDMAKRLGVVGAVTFEERDLSTNPEHLEGFGES